MMATVKYHFPKRWSFIIVIDADGDFRFVPSGLFCWMRPMDNFLRLARWEMKMEMLKENR